MDYTFFISDDGAPKIGLTPTFSSLLKRSNATSVSPLPDIESVGHGWYKFAATIEAGEMYFGVVDAGESSGLSDSDRYIPIQASSLCFSFGRNQSTQCSFLSSSCAATTEHVFRLDRFNIHGEYEETWIEQNAVPRGVTPNVEHFDATEDDVEHYIITLNGTLPSPAVMIS
jgi:hypothetical protein